MTTVRPLPFQIIAVPAKTPQQPKAGLLRRLLNTLLVSRERETERAVDAHVERCGYRLTDSLEREIGELMLDGRSKFHR